MANGIADGFSAKLRAVEWLIYGFEYRSSFANDDSEKIHKPRLQILCAGIMLSHSFNMQGQRAPFIGSGECDWFSHL